MVNFQVYKFLNLFHSGDDFCPSSLPPEIQNDLIASNETTAVSATDPNLDARLFTFFTGDAQTVVVVGALLPQTRRFSTGLGKSEFRNTMILRLGVFQHHLPSLEAPDLQKWLAGKRLPDFQGSCFSTCGGNSASRLLHPHFRFIRQRRFRVVRPRVCWIQGVTFGKPRMVAGHVLRPSKRRVTSPFLGIHATGICNLCTCIYMLPWMVWVWNTPPRLLSEMRLLECSVMCSNA